jgi:hypothetical protein
VEWLDTSGESGYELDWSAATEMSMSFCREAGRPTARAEPLIGAVSHLATSDSIAGLVAAARSFSA